MSLTPDKQLMVYAVGLILGLMIGIAFYLNVELGVNMSLIAFGTIQLLFLVGNFVIFGKYLDKSFVAIIGILSLVTAFFGTYLIDELIFSIIYAGVICIILLAIYLHVEGYNQRY
ncbi:MAG: hypothetical protein KAJ44_03535 [Thermoplasmatales archaeon]|nr:hypothetical protein [Thermoplasmatales archaeon]